MTSISYKLALEKYKKLINNWKKRMLTPIRKNYSHKNIYSISIYTSSYNTFKRFLKNNKFNVLWFYLE